MEIDGLLASLESFPEYCQALECAFPGRRPGRALRRRGGQQEVARRRPGRVSHVVYGSVAEVEQALRDAATAHGVYEKEQLGHHDEQWPLWYAGHMAKAAGLGA